MANCSLKYPFNFRSYSIHTRTWCCIKCSEGGMGEHRMTRCCGGYKCMACVPHISTTNTQQVKVSRVRLGKRSTKTKLKNINKCVVFESILKTFRNRSFKTEKQLFSSEQTIARRAINTCDTASSFLLPCDCRHCCRYCCCLCSHIFFEKKQFCFLRFEKVCADSRGCTFIASFSQHHYMICKRALPVAVAVT